MGPPGTNFSEIRIEKGHKGAGTGSRLGHELLQLSCDPADNIAFNNVSFVPHLLNGICMGCCFCHLITSFYVCFCVKLVINHACLQSP